MFLFDPVKLKILRFYKERSYIRKKGRTMVELDFEVEVEAEFEQVWKYFLDFGTIA